MNSLLELGWNPYFEAYFEAHFDRSRRERLLPGRVAFASREIFRIYGEHGLVTARPLGRLRGQDGQDSLPVTGDWVAMEVVPRGDEAFIHAVLPRRTAIVRKAAGERSAEQVLAANADTLFLAMGLDHDFNVGRLTRALALAWDSGAVPVALLTKRDACADPAARIAEVEAAAPFVPVHAISALTGAGLELLAPYLAAGKTTALLGSSGVGKSTLVNALLGADLVATQEVRAHDGRGRHTTTARHLVRLPMGGLLLDTPGFRELGLLGGEDLSAVFRDIEELGASCRFGDCRHEKEPGCEVRRALDEGRLDAARLESFRKLGREARYAGMRREHAASFVEKKRWKELAGRSLSRATRGAG